MGRGKVMDLGKRSEGKKEEDARGEKGSKR